MTQALHLFQPVIEEDQRKSTKSNLPNESDLHKTKNQEVVPPLAIVYF
jgi:hypothetical protein